MPSQCTTRCGDSSITVIPSTPGLPLFCFTRFSAASAFARPTTCSISQRSPPERSSPRDVVGASPLHWLLGVSPLLSSASSSCSPVFWRMALPCPAFVLLVHRSALRGSRRYYRLG